MAYVSLESKLLAGFGLSWDLGAVEQVGLSANVVSLDHHETSAEGARGELWPRWPDLRGPFTRAFEGSAPEHH